MQLFAFVSLSDVLSLADTNVSVGVVGILGLVAYVAYNTGRKLLATVTSPLKMFTSAYVAAALAVAGGTSAVGLGIGELTAKPVQAQEQTGIDQGQLLLSSKQMMELATEDKDKGANVSKVLEFARERETLMSKANTLAAPPATTPPPVVAPVDPVNYVERPTNHRLGWSSLLGGIGLSIVGCVVGFKRMYDGPPET